MKKNILIATGIALLISGCNSIANSSNLEIQKLADEDTMLPTYEAVDKITDGIPDYVEVDKNTKYKEDEGIAAFFIPEQFSNKKEDIRSFDFLGKTRADTFLYSYATKITQGSQAGQEVHCVAEYNYETVQYREIHQVIGGNPAELEPFHVSILYDGGERKGIAVYDNGRYYYYDMDGNLMIQTAIGNFISRQYIKNTSLQISEVVNRDKNRMYLLLNLQSDKINADFDNKDWGKLEKEMEDKIVSRLLTYDLKKVDGEYECVQEIANYQDAVDYWTDLTDGQEFSAAPDKDADWRLATKQNPMEAGAIYLEKDGKQWPVYTWDGELGFLSEDGDGRICNFKVDQNRVKKKTEVIDSQFKDEDLVIMDDHYYGISGILSKKKVVTEVISRTWYYIDNDGNSHEKTQTMEVPKYYRMTIDHGFLEGYWLLDKDISAIFAAADSDILISTGKKMFWQKENGGRKEVFKDVKEDSTAVYIPADSGAYIAMSGEKKLFIHYDDIHSTASGDVALPYERLTFSYEKGNGAYDQKLDDYVGNDFQIYNSREKFGENQILDLGGKRFLIASQKNGLLLYDSNSDSIRQISKGTWLNLWKEDDMVLAIGFSSEDKSYEMKDLLYGKIKKYRISDL